MQQLEQKLIKAAEHYDAVAFDVFDTLLFRDTAAPSDLFSLMEETGLAPKGFAQKRREAEAMARTPGREVTLEEIYAQPPMQGLDSRVEFEAELRVAVPNRALLQAARTLQEQGKALYAISDMYLSVQQVTQLLEHCGFDFLNGIYVSSAYGVQKRSGKLFRVFLEQTELAPSQVLFVGNDRRVDIAGSALAGIRGFLIPEPKPLPYYPQPSHVWEGAVQAFIQNRLPDGDRLEMLGFSLIGPLLTAFAVWLHETYSEAENNRLMFLARDMYLVRQIYAELYGQETDYLKVSRHSLCPALLQRPMNEEGLALLADALPRQVMTVGQVLDYCGFDTSVGLHGTDVRQTVDLRTRPLTAAVKEKLLGLAALGKTTAGACVRQRSDLVRAYLHQNQIREKPPVLVDIGSGGTTQRILECLCATEMQGACFACDTRLHQGLPADRAKAFLFRGNPAPLWYWVGQPMLERLISEPCGATGGYKERQGKVSPVLETAQFDERIVRVQHAALRFARSWRDGPWWEIPLPEEMLTSAYLDLVRSPALRDIRELGTITVEDGGTWMLAAPKSWRHYLKRPKSFAQDFRQARWKNAFLKQAIRLPLPYARLYEMLKSKHGR
nr:HAD family hydrolase [uncultured Gemmiger sp.]